MTEKRFTIGMLKTFVNDNKTNYCYSLELPSNAEHLCGLLNGLSDENEQLKSRIQYLENKIQRERNATHKQYEKWEQEAIKENEQLKKELEKYDEWCGSVKRENIDKVLKMSVFEIVGAFEYYTERIKDYERILSGDLE